MLSVTHIVSQTAAQAVAPAPPEIEMGGPGSHLSLSLALLEEQELPTILAWTWMIWIFPMGL